MMKENSFTEMAFRLPFLMHLSTFPSKERFLQKKKKNKGNFSHFPLKIILAENQRLTSSREKSLILITFLSIKGARERFHFKNKSMGDKTGRSWRTLSYVVL